EDILYNPQENCVSEEILVIHIFDDVQQNRR
ncbi:unnamed protein product, partial [marine sediment metagenome]